MLFGRSLNLNLSVTGLGLLVILILAVLFIFALFFALAARRQAKRTARANRELESEIGERKRAEDALRKANEELRQFAYVAAHDLQEPLRNVKTSLGILSRRHALALDAEARELIDESVEDAQRLHGMVKDLLGLATIADNLEPPAAPVDANEVIRQVLKTFREDISEHRAEVISGGLPAVRVHENHLFELFQNLIGNALKYARPDVPPSITIAVQPRESAWSFSVRDNGIGFHPEFASEIFTIFRRLHQRHEYPGRGIGLAICSKIVSAYGGSIWAEGRPNEGAVFQFTLPRAQGES
jgi:light-regulated signal transduction histidine kinase (bacteriophytochrome)